MKLPNEEQAAVLLASAMPIIETFVRQLACERVCAQLAGNSDRAAICADQHQQMMKAGIGTMGAVSWGMAVDCIEARFDGSDVAIRFDAGGNILFGFMPKDRIEIAGE